jgi:nitroimidazol reductase NimA-like FMN-containing flavoprotein (pyridoxamine 5'-phosphate oxidase superfamily)
LVASHHALPIIRPVPFRLIDEAVVVPVLPRGTIALAAQRHEVVAFEADHVDARARSGWSVVVTGVAESLPNEIHANGAWSAWARTGRTTLLKLPVTDVIGRLGTVVWA